MENIIETLKEQHKGLKQQLESAMAETKAEKPNGADVVHNLNDFGTLLKAHLLIEDGIFYPKILEKMRSKNMPTAGTEEFIKHMGVIAKDVYEFLDKYKEPGEIENDIKNFKQNLEKITSTLVLRITSEEDGVYMYWNL